MKREIEKCSESNCAVHLLSKKNTNIYNNKIPYHIQCRITAHTHYIMEGVGGQCLKVYCGQNMRYKEIDVQVLFHRAVLCRVFYRVF
jgi:hypothetical protein